MSKGIMCTMRNSWFRILSIHLECWNEIYAVIDTRCEIYTVNDTRDKIYTVIETRCEIYTVIGSGDKNDAVIDTVEGIY